MRRTTLHLVQNTTLVYFISFIEGTYQRFILVLYFDTSHFFLVAIFILDFLMFFFGFLPLTRFVTSQRRAFLIE